jgi:hypothetical protein
MPVRMPMSSHDTLMILYTMMMLNDVETTAVAQVM